jgi:hypothetical protein
VKVSGRRDRLRLRLEPPEIELLQTLLAELTAVVADADADDAVVQRLFPSAYPDDGAADADYRSITESSLRRERRDRITGCLVDLAAGSDVPLGDDADAQRWIKVLNDLRLALGTRLGVTEEQVDIDPTDPESRPWLIYYWLTATQDSVVTALMTRMPHD